MPKYAAMTFFIWRLTVYGAKFRQMHAVVTIMASDNHVLQFPERKREDYFWKIIADIDILLFLRGLRA